MTFLEFARSIVSIGSASTHRVKLYGEPDTWNLLPAGTNIEWKSVLRSKFLAGKRIDVRRAVREACKASESLLRGKGFEVHFVGLRSPHFRI
jgi:hypothetical protein